MYCKRIYVSGISYRANIDKFKVRIRVNGKQIEVGLFKSFNDAVAARQAAEEKYNFKLVQWLEGELNKYEGKESG